MAMCTSGSLGLISAPQAGCSSIACGVTGSNTSPPYTLSTLGTTAGKGSPYAMTDFYGYAPPKCVYLSELNSNGGDGSSYSWRCFAVCTNPAMASGECFTLCLLNDQCTSSQASGSFSCVCITCNAACKYCCCLGTASPCSLVYSSFIMDNNDAVTIYNFSCASNTSCSSGVGTRICIASVASVVGSFCVGTPNCCCTYTG